MSGNVSRPWLHGPHEAGEGSTCNRTGAADAGAGRRPRRLRSTRVGRLRARRAWHGQDDDAGRGRVGTGTVGCPTRPAGRPDRFTARSPAAPDPHRGRPGHHPTGSAGHDSARLVSAVVASLRGARRSDTAAAQCTRTGVPCSRVAGRLGCWPLAGGIGRRAGHPGVRS